MYIKKNNHKKKTFFMNLALLQAKKNVGNTQTNPSVGCVIVKNNCLIGVGSTGLNGIPHAEKNAILYAKRNTKNSELFSTLEPCSHYGKTPPCVHSIIKSGIKKVYFSLKDPDQRSYNKSKLSFKNNKVISQNGFNKKKIKKFYRSYLKYKSNKLPFVSAKIAISKDYYSKNIKKKWITNKFSRSRVHLLRSMHDCLITSYKTVIADNPRYTCRINGLENRSPARAILDKNLMTPIKSHMVDFAKKYKTIIFYNKGNIKKITKLKKLNIKLIKMELLKNKRFDLEKILFKLKYIGFSRIFLESGINLIANFLKYNLIDDLYLFISNKKINSNGMNSIKKSYNLYMRKKDFIKENVNLFGDSLISFKIK